MLSVLLISYNHSQYIHKALDSIFMQKYEGEIELVVGDDNSTDNTLQIIKEYEGKDPRFKFKYLHSENNVGTTKNYQRSFHQCTGKYTAIIEGDDYWTSPYKLLKMMSFLDEHLECSMVSHNYFVYLEGEKKFYPRVEIGSSFRRFGARELIHDNIIGNFSTCMYRTSVLKSLPRELFDVKSYDWIINIISGSEALLGFIEEPMSVYRIHSKGVWSQSNSNQQLQQCLDMIPVYNDLTQNIFETDFMVLSNRIEKNISIQEVKNILPKKSKKIITVIIDYLPPIVKHLIFLFLPPKLFSFLKKSV
ncbi:glycosyltransferase family 2 protein [Aeromonas sobria]|uniref:glycosyltransferase family 2 protein n=1 Tax=Aeromonas sobria TaxID=646 RepID=UPI000C6CE995|nr:glycosyltransferase [Aeromonas sobria]PKQ74559.1 glycosyl transferase [Aeromonas sobria]